MRHNINTLDKTVGRKNCIAQKRDYSKKSGNESKKKRKRKKESIPILNSKYECSIHSNNLR